MENIEQIKKENWREAEGIKASSTETNAGLATRDYSVKCYLPKLIIQVEGYFVWWCSSHHQPYYRCEIEKMKLEAISFAELVENSDKTINYEYSGKDKKNNKDENPPIGTRLLSPKELASEFIKKQNK